MGNYELIKVNNGIDKNIINEKVFLNHTDLGKKIINFYASYGVKYIGSDNKEIFIPFCAPSPNQVILNFPDAVNFNNNDILFTINFLSIFKEIKIKSEIEDYMRVISSTLRGELYYFDNQTILDKNIEIFQKLGLCKIADEYIKDEFAYKRFTEISKKLEKK